MRLEAIDPLTDSRWADLVELAPEATIFHHPAWLRLLRDHYGYAVYAWCLGNGGRPSAGLPLALIRSRLTGTRLVALPFSDAVPPLTDPGAAPAPEALARALASERERSGYSLEVRWELPPGPGVHPADEYVLHRLDLARDLATVEAGFSKSQVKRAINKAHREEVEVERRTDADALGRFYRLHMQTRRRQGVPTQPRRFVLRFAELFAQGLGFVLLARHRGADAAAAVFLAAGGTLTYKYGASDPAHLSARPNNLLFMEAIRWGVENGQHTLDFGRTDLDNEGLRRFKSAWGAAEMPLRYTVLGPPPPARGAGFAQRAMKVAIQRAPAPFGRFVGETLYRHFG